MDSEKFINFILNNKFFFHHLLLHKMSIDSTVGEAHRMIKIW